MSIVITGINPSIGPPAHGTIIVQGPKGLGSGVLDTNYKISDYTTALPTLVIANAAYSGRFDDTSYYVT